LVVGEEVEQVDVFVGDVSHPPPAPLAVVACGGGTEGGNASASGTVATVIIEERAGKTVLDAWFEQGSSTAFSQSQQNLDTCVVNPNVSRQRAPTLVNGATQVSLVNRGGVFASLVPNQLNADTVYTTDARWLSSPVSDDASLVFESSSRFQSLGIVSLPTLTPLNWVTPSSGELNSSDDSLQWEASSNSNTAVKINLSVTHPGSVSGDSTVVVCYVTDDGQFQLDATTKQRLNFVGGTVVMRAQRVRTQVYGSGDTQLNVVQVSHGRSI